MKRILIALALFATALALHAQQAPEPQKPEASPPEAAKPGLTVEKLGAGDVVRVTVFQQPDLTTEARISDKGMISMPLIGEVKIGGMSAGAAANQIAADLK